MADVADVSLVKKPSTKSIVWNYFGLQADGDGKIILEKEDRPVCRACKKAVQAKGGNTTNLLTHLRDHHPDLYAEAVPASSRSSRRQPTLQEVVAKGKAYDSKSLRAQELNRAVMYFIAKDMQPLYTVEKPGFRHLISTLDARYNIPSRKYFTKRELPKLYCEVRDEVVMPKLREMKYFAATSDLWTSSAKHPYLSYTIHFIDDSWSLQSFVLDTVPLFEDHTGQNIAEAFQDILSNWSLSPDNLVATTTDNGSNFVSGLRLLEWMRLSCFGHNLDLAISKSLASHRIQRAIGKCHSLIELFNRSWKKSRDLHQKQCDLGLKEHNLISVSYVNLCWCDTNTEFHAK